MWPRAWRQSPGPASARAPRTRSSKSARCGKCRISRRRCSRRPPDLRNCRAARTDPDSNQGRYAMSDTYLAVFIGSKTSAKMAAWNALSETERKTKEKAGVAGWKTWVEKHQAALAEMGGPLGKTKRVGAGGIADVSNEIGAFTVVRAESHEAAAKMFENHPHFSI